MMGRGIQFHGAKNKRVPLKRSQKMIDDMNEEDSEPELIEAFDNSKFYQWFLAQKRKPNDE